MKQSDLTPTELRVLQNIHLNGCTGRMGSLNLAQRRKVIFGLVEKKLLNDKARLTPLGIELSAPFQTIN